MVEKSEFVEGLIKSEEACNKIISALDANDTTKYLDEFMRHVISMTKALEKEVNNFNLFSKFKLLITYINRKMLVPKNLPIFLSNPRKKTNYCFSLVVICFSRLSKVWSFKRNRANALGTNLEKVRSLLHSQNFDPKEFGDFEEAIQTYKNQIGFEQRAR